MLHKKSGGVSYITSKSFAFIGISNKFPMKQKRAVTEVEYVSDIVKKASFSTISDILYHFVTALRKIIPNREALQHLQHG